MSKDKTHIILVVRIVFRIRVTSTSVAINTWFGRRRIFIASEKGVIIT